MVQTSPNATDDMSMKNISVEENEYQDQEWMNAILYHIDREDMYQQREDAKDY